MSSHRSYDRPDTVLLDSARSTDDDRRTYLFTDPVDVLEIHEPTELPTLLDRVEHAVDRGYYAAGYVGYECGRAFESVGDSPRDDGTVQGPAAWFGIYHEPESLDAICLPDGPSAENGIELENPAFSFDRRTYADRFRTIKQHIRDGDVYQINFTGRVTFDFTGEPIDLYRRLRANQNAPFAAYLRAGDRTILCLSPELFFHRRGRHIVTRPMKGTIRRGRTLDEDQELRKRLAEDPKSRAENLMIVDLLRNDLAKISRPQSVNVPELFSTETYRTVTQMTSTVEAELTEDVTYRDIFRALFPCGSVTGAPKIRAMNIIDRLEIAPRGIYCGSIGYISPHDEAIFNVAIRTVELDGGRGSMGTGGGIVWDSDADREYDECALKADFLTGPSDPFYLIETIRWQDRYHFLARHLDRLQRSAAFFDYPLSRHELRNALMRRQHGLENDRTYKVRIALHETGHWEISAKTVEAPNAEPWRFTISDEPIDSGNKFRFHKTSRRENLDEHYRRAEATGYDEVVFLNRHGEVTEGSRSNLFIRDGETYFTPPVSCGLLAGVYRSYLLESLPKAEEKVLYPEDLARADEIFLCNAIRGKHPAYADLPVTPGR